MELDSFIVDTGNQGEWKKYKQEERCFGVYTLFHEEKDRFFY
jgi:hypothetical protein